MVGSANLTLSALGTSGNNIELCLIETKSGKARSEYRAGFKSWAGSYNGHLMDANDTVVNKYAKARLDFLKKNPVIFDHIEPPADISVAKSLMMQVGAGSGMDRHQVEFNLPLVSYFAKQPKNRIDLTLVRGGSIWKNRPLTPKTTSFGVDIFRLGMPTTRSGGEHIANRAILFTRTGNPLLFEFDVDDIGGTKYNKWISDCNKDGHIGSTSGGRIYGYLF